MVASIIIWRLALGRMRSVAWLLLATTTTCKATGTQSGGARKKGSSSQQQMEAMPDSEMSRIIDTTATIKIVKKVKMTVRTTMMMMRTATITTTTARQDNRTATIVVGNGRNNNNVSQARLTPISRRHPLSQTMMTAKTTVFSINIIHQQQHL